MSRSFSSEEVTLFPDRPLEVHFDLAGFTLIPGCVGELAEPIEECLKLFAEKPGEALRPIESPADLSKIVTRIRDSSEALEFVRVFTSPDSFYLFEREEDCIECSVIPDSAPPGYGTLAASRARELGLPPPRVALGGGGFVIERALVCTSSLSGPRRLRLRIEAVSGEGRYSLLEDRPLATLPSAEIRMPYHE